MSALKKKNLFLCDGAIGTHIFYIYRRDEELIIRIRDSGCNKPILSYRDFGKVKTGTFYKDA